MIPRASTAHEAWLSLLVVLVGGMTLVLAPRPAAATPVGFILALTVENVECATNAPPCGGHGPGSFDPLPHVGHTYYSFFAVQDSLLSQTGVNLPGTLTAFHLQIENLVWDPFTPSPDNVFSGFRGPIPGNPACPGGVPGHCLGASSPGFDVANGTITAISNGVYGSGDAPFVDFAYIHGPNGFGSADLSNIYVTGAVTVSRVPAPPAFFLLGCAVVALVGVTRKRGRRVLARAVLRWLTACAFGPVWARRIPLPCGEATPGELMR